MQPAALEQTAFNSEFSLASPLLRVLSTKFSQCGSSHWAHPPRLMADEAGGQGAAPHLLDLPEDVLLRIGLHLKLHERLQLAGVCRKLRQLCAGPSELWRVLQVVLRGEEGEEAALRQLVCFRRQARLGRGRESRQQLYMHAGGAHLAEAAVDPSDAMCAWPCVVLVTVDHRLT